MVYVGCGRVVRRVTVNHDTRVRFSSVNPVRGVECNAVSSKTLNLMYRVQVPAMLPGLR